MKSRSPFTISPVTFSLSDIGSEVIDQLASDIHTSPGAIIRELVKNAYDSYLELDPDAFEERGIERAVYLNTSEFKDGRRLYVADHGIGLSLDELKAFVQIAIRPKREAREDLPCTGFRGLGTWSTLGAGCQILVESQKFDTRERSRLTINVRRIYEKMGPETTLDDILNDRRCIEFASYLDEAGNHGTTVEIVCDGQPERIQKYEINRLYPYAAPEMSRLRELVVESCPIPYAKVDSLSEQICRIYQKVGYNPTSIYVGAEKLERRLPNLIFRFVEQPLTLDNSLVAVTWRVFRPDKSGTLKEEIDPTVHVLNGPSLQLCKYNVPIGPKATDSQQLNNYIGEVHIVHADLLPNADGTGLRQGPLTSNFQDVLKNFYSELDTETRAKSIRLSTLKTFQRATTELSKDSSSLSTGERVERESAIKKAVELVDAPRRERGNDDDVEDARAKVKRLLKQKGYYDSFSTKKRSANIRGIQKFKVAPESRSLTPSVPVIAKLERSEFQKLAPLVIPRLEQLGLKPDDIKAILNIFEESLCI
jgi:hypothetical protein